MARFRVQISVSIILSVLCAWLSASELRDNTSLKWAPDSVAMYAAAYRLEQQWNNIQESKAFNKFKNIPMLQMGMMQVKQQWNAPDGKMSQVREFIENPENAGLIQLREGDVR